MKVKSVTRIKLKDLVPVYDLSVPGTENFVLANGATVHNSKDVADSLCGAYNNLLTRAETWRGRLSDMEDSRYGDRPDGLDRHDGDRPI